MSERDMSNKVNRSNNKKKSLCEKSMKIMMNILKMSYLSLARESLGGKTTAPTRVSSTGNHGYSSSSTNLGSNVVEVPVATPMIPRDYPARLIKISQQPENSSKRSTCSYLVDPNVGNESSTTNYVVKQKVSSVETMNGKKNEKVSSSVGPINRKKDEKVSVDHQASNYIRRFHEKNQKDPNSISKSFSSSSSYIILPPPPPPRIK